MIQEKQYPIQDQKETPMPNSFAQTAPLTCPSCQKEFEVEVWLIVDSTEQPALLEKIEAGKLHEVACPHCQFIGHLDMPLLLYRPEQAAPLVFSPAQRTDEATDRQHIQGAIGTLQESLGEAWQAAWGESLQVIPRSILQVFLRDGEQAARDQWEARHAPAQSVLDSLPLELRVVFEEITRSGIKINTPEDLERILQQRPDLRDLLNQAIQPGQDQP